MKPYTAQEFRDVVDALVAEVADMSTILIEVVDIDNHPLRDTKRIVERLF